VKKAFIMWNGIYRKKGREIIEMHFTCAGEEYPSSVGVNIV